MEQPIERKIDMKKTLQIEGMSCGHCVMRVEKALSKVQGVSKVQVSLSSKTAEVEGDNLETANLIQAVVSSGYQAEE